jgi:hypothetical protein
MKRRLDPLMILRARAEARALLYQGWEISNLEEAVKPLIEYAESSGLLRQLGEPVILAVIRHSFDGVSQEDEWQMMWTKPFEHPELI